MKLFSVWFKVYGPKTPINKQCTEKFSKFLMYRFGDGCLRLDTNFFLLKFPLNQDYDSEILKSEIEPELNKLKEQNNGSYEFFVNEILNPPEHYLRLQNQRWLKQQPNEN